MLRNRFLPVLALVAAVCALAPPRAQAQLAITQTSTSRKLVFLMVSSTDHISAVTGLTPTVTLSKNGAAFAAPAGTVAEIANGFYALSATSADTGTLGSLILHATGTGADPADKEFNVIAVNPDDATAFGIARMDAAITTRALESGGLLAAVKTVTDKFLFDGSSYVKGSTYAYGSGQDPGTLVLGATVDSGRGFTLNVKDCIYLSFLGQTGKFGTPVRTVSSPWTITVPFLRLDGSTTGWTYTTTYTDNTFSRSTGRDYTPGTLP